MVLTRILKEWLNIPHLLCWRFLDRELKLINQQCPSHSNIDNWSTDQINNTMCWLFWLEVDIWGTQTFKNYPLFCLEMSEVVILIIIPPWAFHSAPALSLPAHQEGPGNNKITIEFRPGSWHWIYLERGFVRKILLITTGSSTFHTFYIGLYSTFGRLTIFTSSTFQQKLPE